jgi:putative ABC transport system permease protein
MTLALPSGAQEASLVYALDDFRRWNIPWNVEEGDLTDLGRGQYVFLDASAEKRFGPFSVGEYREYLGQRMKIVGRSRDALSFSTTPISFMDFSRAQKLSYQTLANKTTYVLVKLAPGADLEKVRAEIRRRLPYNDVYTKSEWAKRSRTYWVESTGLGLNMMLTVFLGCLVGVVVVAQTLYTSTMEHIKEFGTVKAIGGGNGDIYRILGKQAAIAAVIGFLLGAAMSYAMRPAIAKISLKLIIPPSLAVAVFAGAVVLCLAAAMISFRKVASIDPALVFRT